jgi:hypothetical protein
MCTTPAPPPVQISLDGELLRYVVAYDRHEGWVEQLIPIEKPAYLDQTVSLQLERRRRYGEVVVLVPPRTCR